MNKKLVIGLLFVAGIAGASCMGPYCWDDRGMSLGGFSFNGNGLVIPVLSSTTITNITPSNAGQLVICNSCANVPGSYTLCLSTSSNPGSFVLTDSTGGVVAGLTSCK